MKKPRLPFTIHPENWPHFVIGTFASLSTFAIATGLVCLLIYSAATLWGMLPNG